MGATADRPADQVDTPGCLGLNSHRRDTPLLQELSLPSDDTDIDQKHLGLYTTARQIGCLSAARRVGMHDDCTRHHLRVAKSPVHIGPLRRFAWNESRAMQRAYAVQRGWGGMTGFEK